MDSYKEQINILPKEVVYNEYYIHTGAIKCIDKSMNKAILKYADSDVHVNCISRILKKPIIDLPKKITLLEVLKLDIRIVRKLITQLSNQKPTNVSLQQGTLLVFLVKRKILVCIDNEAIIDKRFLNFIMLISPRTLFNIGTPLISTHVILNSISGVLSDIDPSTHSNINNPSATGDPLEILAIHRGNLISTLEEIRLGIESNNILEQHGKYIENSLFQMYYQLGNNIQNIYNFGGQSLGIYKETLAVILSRYLSVEDDIFGKIKLTDFPKTIPIKGNIYSTIPLRECYRLAWRHNIDNPSGKPIYLNLATNDKISHLLTDIKNGKINYDNLEEIYIYLSYYNVDTNLLINFEKGGFINAIITFSTTPVPINNKLPIVKAPRKCRIKNGIIVPVDKIGRNSIEDIYENAKLGNFSLSPNNKHYKLFKMLATYRPKIEYKLFAKIRNYSYNCVKLILLMKGLSLIQVSIMNYYETLTTICCGVIPKIENYKIINKLYRSAKDNEITITLISRFYMRPVVEHSKTLLGNTIFSELEIYRQYIDYPNFQLFLSINNNNFNNVLENVGCPNNAKYIIWKNMGNIVNADDKLILGDFIVNIDLYLHIDVNRTIDTYPKIEDLKYYSNKVLLKYFKIADVYSRQQLIKIVSDYLNDKTVVYIGKRDINKFTVTYANTGSSDKVSLMNDFPIYNDIVNNNMRALSYLIVDPKQIYASTSSMLNKANLTYNTRNK